MRRGRRAALAFVLAAGAVAALPPASADAQEWRRSREPRSRLEPGAGEIPYDGRLTFARIRFEPRDPWSGWAFGMPAWAHDYPVAERNFMQILAEITTARTFAGGSRIVELDDPALFRYPIAYLCEPGHWTLTDAQAEGLRNYLLKGGFLIFDDFARSDCANVEAVMNRVLPGVEFFPLDVGHPLFNAFFQIESLEMRHPNQRVMAEFLAVYEDNDPSGRLLAVVNYNNDIGDYFEYSATGWVPVDVSNEAYKLGVNYWMWALTH